MDWFFDARDPSAARALRQELAAYLRRHADAGGEIALAEVAFSELITNAARHAPGPAWVHLDWSRAQPSVEVHDLGPGFELRAVLPEDPLAVGGRGLFMVDHIAGELQVAAKRAGGSRVSAVLPVARAIRPRSRPPLPLTPSLPAPDEASDDGTFDREAFLRALVVEMARAVEMDHGPAVAEETIDVVGASIGGRIEHEYRRARGIVGTLTPEQIADLCVRLKAAIEGDFYVIEVSDERIVLGNRRCPFGDAVMRAPGLCRMTASVFEGIAARNSEGAEVRLEERIALGDRECRVTIALRPQPTAV